MSRRKVLGERYRIGEVIGSGAFSTVYYCEDLCTKETHAVKVINKHKLNDLGMSDAFEREIACMKAIQTPFVTNFVEILASGRNYYLIMELADGGTLLTITARNGGLPGHIARKYFRQLLEGVTDIHAAGVVHRDIKPENLLLDGYRDLRIADFGLAAFADDARVLKRQCGSPHYVAPEVLSGKGYNGRQADVWSMGISLFVMAYGVLPFVAPTTDKLYDKISSGKFTFPQRSLGSQKVAETLQHLITVCLRVDSKKRWTLGKVSRHPWVKGRDTFPKLVPASSPASQYPFGPSPTTTNGAFPFTPQTANAGMFPTAPPLSDSSTQETAAGGSNGAVNPHLPLGVSPSMDFMGNLSFSELDGSAYKDPTISAAEAADQYWDSIAVATSSCPSILYKREKLSGAPGGVMSDEDGSAAACFEGSKSAKFSLRKKRSSHYGSQSGYGGSQHSYAETPRHGSSKSTTPHLPSQREATPQQQQQQLKPQGPLWRRLEKDHLICLLHIQLVFFIVLVVGLMRLLFDVNIVNWPLPPPLRRLLEQAMTPPELSRKGAGAGAAGGGGISSKQRGTPQDSSPLGGTTITASSGTGSTPAPRSLDEMSFDDRDIATQRPKLSLGGGRLSRRPTENEDDFAIPTPRGTRGGRGVKRIGSSSLYGGTPSSNPGLGSPRGFTITKSSGADFGAQSATTVSATTGSSAVTRVLPHPEMGFSSSLPKKKDRSSQPPTVGASASSRRSTSRRQIDDDKINMNTKTLEVGQSLMYQKDDWLKKDKNVKFADDVPSSMDSASGNGGAMMRKPFAKVPSTDSTTVEPLSFDPISTKDEEEAVEGTTPSSGSPLASVHHHRTGSMGSSGHTPQNSSLSASIVKSLNMKKVSSVGGDLDTYNDAHQEEEEEEAAKTDNREEDSLELSGSTQAPPKRTNTAEAGGLRRRRPLQNLDTSTPETH